LKALLGIFASLFIAHPWLALVPAIAFALLFGWTGRRTLVVVASMWFLYAVYEYAHYRRWLCSGECDIRLDLLLLYPFLLVVSLVGVAVALRALLYAEHQSRPPDRRN